jgi:hypothetical protein
LIVMQALVPPCTATVQGPIGLATNRSDLIRDLYALALIHGGRLLAPKSRRR